MTDDPHIARLVAGCLTATVCLFLIAFAVAFSRFSFPILSEDEIEDIDQLPPESCFELESTFSRIVRGVFSQVQP